MNSIVTESTEFELIPYVGAGAIRFGMTQAEIAMHLGPPERVSLDYLKNEVEFRSFMNVGYGAVANDPKSNSTAHFGFGRQMTGVMYEGTRIFQADHRAVLEILADKDGCPYVYLGFIVLLNLGITLTGFHDDDESDRGLAMFPQGAWNKRLPKLEKFSHRGSPSLKKR